MGRPPGGPSSRANRGRGDGVVDEGVLDDSVVVNVLAVDDRPANLLAVESVLENSGVSVLSATDADQALRHLLRHDVAMILLDVQMPKHDGYQIAALIRQRERTRDTPIIFITAASP